MCHFIFHFHLETMMIPYDKPLGPTPVTLHILEWTIALTKISLCHPLQPMLFNMKV